MDDRNDWYLELNDRIAELEEAIRDLWPRAAFTMSDANRASWAERLSLIGIDTEDLK